MAGESILIVEDHTMIAEYVASILGNAGYKAIQAPTLAAARRALAGQRFDLLLCDRFLPDGEGHDLLSAMGDGTAQPRTPAIILSADMDSGERAMLLALGFVDALAKPCPPPRLLQSVRAALDGQGAIAKDPPPATQAAAEPVLDDAAALHICAGSRDTLVSMRRLFAADLPALRQRLATFAATGDATRTAQELHRLSAAAAWCGAAQVKAACERACRDPAGGLDELDAALARVLAALQT